MIKFQQHDFEGGSLRTRQMRTAVITFITDTVDKFVVCKGHSAVNTAALQQMVKEDAGIDMKKHQA